MKKIIIMLAVAACTFAANADDVSWSWWCDSDNKNRSVDLSFGLGSKCASVECLELSLIYSASPEVEGMQWAFMGINNSKMTGILQLAPWFNNGGTPCVQLGFLNIAKKSVFTMGFISIADSSKVQLGLLNFNKNGFLPVFPFINLDKSLFE
jgi:hypothetical protein